ncbi:MAG: glycosyltransferase family 4 protein [Spirochaetota bacterium]|nr:MAG: glycosyltransferase family 4 protein [Spirochaetota bacterium]
MKTVCHILPYMAEGGTEKTAYNILHGFKGRYNLILLAPNGVAISDFLKLDIIYKEFPEIKGNIFGKIDVFKKILLDVHKQYGIDLLHVHAAHEFLSFSKKVLPSTPLIFHLHSHQGSNLSKLVNYKLSATIARKKADMLIAVSEEEKRIITTKGYPETRIEVVYNGFEEGGEDDIKKIDEIKRLYELDNSFIIGNLGRLNRTKRLDLLIRAFRLLKKRVPAKLTLLMIGDGPQKENLMRLAQKECPGGDIVFPGFINRGDRVLKIFDIFALPTTFEGCSNVLIEAMSKSLPIVTTDIPTVSWMFENRKDVLLFKKNSVQDLADKLYELVSNTELRESLQKNIQNRFKNLFTLEVMLKRIDDIYKKFIG